MVWIGWTLYRERGIKDIQAPKTIDEEYCEKDMNYELKIILEKIKGIFICVYGVERKIFSSIDEFENSEFERNCNVSSISVQDGVIVLELKKLESPMPDMNGEWAKEHEKQFGEKPSFF